MLIGDKSKYLLKRVRAKAKMNEYHIPEELHGEMDQDARYLLVLAIATIGDFSNDILDNYNDMDCDIEEHKKNLQFSSRFFNAYLEAEMYEGEQSYYLLLGAAVYYLCGYNGSSKVLADRIHENIELNISQIDYVLTQILKDKEEVEYTYDIELLNEVVNSYNSFQKEGIKFDFDKLIQLKKFIYNKGTDREILFCDVLVAVIYLKIHNSSYQLLPEYTHIEREVWVDILQKGTLIKELWQSQQKLGENGIFKGQSATIQMPTSSGKTKSVALIILSSFLSKRTNNAVVVAPFRSLCREISEELQKAFSFNDKIHVNEVSDVMQMDLFDVFFNEGETEEKHVFVVTPEKLLFILRQDILISAVIPNAEQVNEWITDGSGVVIKNNINHGGIPMGIRSSVEYAMQVGKIKFIACTSTLAQGVNLPIRYLIISNVYQSKERIKVRDFQNLIGRAGRAGIYTEGTILLSETNIYRLRKDPFYNWRWNNYKKLLNNEEAESCTSALFARLRADSEMEKYLENVIKIFTENYADRNFNSKVKEYLKLQEFASEETYSKAEFIINQMIKNIESIESFLLFYLVEDSYEKSKETIHDIIKETLAYYLAKEKERERLLKIVDLIGEFLVQTVNTADKRNRYSKSLLGITKEIFIEQWVSTNLEEMQNCTTETAMLKVLFPLLLENENAIVSKCANKELLSNIAMDWIEGKSYLL